MRQKKALDQRGSNKKERQGPAWLNGKTEKRQK
jgi:hypothetical protein